MKDTMSHSASADFGTAENPLVNPVTGERIVFHKRARDTGGELLEMTVFMAPGGFIATPHIHPEQEERFTVGGAAVVLRAGGVEKLHQPGEEVVVPAGVLHNWWNASETEAATLVQLRPALNAETMFETFFGLAGDGKVNAKGMPNPLHMMVLAHAYRREAKAPPPLGWIAGPMARGLSPIGRLLGYRSRYDKYSGPMLRNLAADAAPESGPQER